MISAFEANHTDGFPKLHFFRILSQYARTTFTNLYKASFEPLEVATDLRDWTKKGEIEANFEYFSTSSTLVSIYGE